MTKVFITGASMVPVNRHYDMSLFDLAESAFMGLRKTVEEMPEVDAIIVTNSFAQKLENQSMLGFKLSKRLGLSGKLSMTVEQGDASGGAGILAAYSIVKSGVARNVIVVGLDKFSDFPSKFVNDAVSTTLEDVSYYEGLLPAPYGALIMKSYMRKYGVKEDYFYDWAIKMHSNALENPYAYLRFPVDSETIRKSQEVSTPMKLFDIAPRADGASSVLISSEDFKKVSDSPVEIEAVEFDSGEPTISSLEFPLRKAQVRGDKTAIEISDSFSVSAAIELESLGLAEKGKSLESLDSLNVNLSGGLKARGYPGGATGIYQVAEVYMQLIDQFPGKKARDAEEGLVLNTDDLLRTSYMIYLKR
jgi:acetyl-CoA acetyltransferase